MNSVVVTVLYLLRALHHRIIVHHILSKIKRTRASLDTAIYVNKQSDCLLSRSKVVLYGSPTGIGLAFIPVQNHATRAIKKYLTILKEIQNTHCAR